MVLNKVSSELQYNKDIILIIRHSIVSKETCEMILSYHNTFYKVSPLSCNIALNDTNLDGFRN